MSSNTIHGKVYSIQHYVTGRWFSLGTPVSSTNKTDRHYIAEILLKVALNTTNQPTNQIYNPSVALNVELSKSNRKIDSGSHVEHWIISKLKYADVVHQRNIWPKS